jgi:DNA repair protein RecN (Recombination protein N)
MLISLSIRNYALIENLKVDFRGKLSIITGETGAGKSILLGGLALVLGKRADASLVYDKEKKCIIEAEFAIESYNLLSFFEENDLDYDPVVIIRRELLPNGKSRAFVNDTPTTLSVLNNLTEQLIDVHSQHETLQLSDPEYQFHIIDSLAKNEQLLIDYRVKFNRLKSLVKELNQIKDRQQHAQKEYDYNLFVWNELDQANLKEEEQDDLEKDLEKLSHVEEIKMQIAEVIDIAEMEQMGALSQLSHIGHNLSRISGFADLYHHLSERVKSLLIEFKDIVDELQSENDELVYDPVELSRVEERLKIIYDLQKKHAATSVADLLEIKEVYENKIIEVDNAEEVIAKKQSEIAKAETDLGQIAEDIHKRRTLAIPEFIEQIETVLSNLEMKNTRFRINLIKSEHFLSNGKDKLEFLMSSDKGKNFESLKRVASGGEMSRTMLGIKSILSKYSNLPAIIFDEIDTGVSGEVSNRIAEVMLAMSQNMQVITITHLPQIAAKGQQHYKVYKEDNNGAITSNIKLLNEEERLVELAEMLGGSKITESAMAHAKQLLS